MESWLKTQYKLTTRRYKTLRIPKKLKYFLNGPSYYNENSDSCLITSEPQSHNIVEQDHTYLKSPKITSSDKPQPQLWRSFSLQSLRSRRESKKEQRRRPMIPPVMKTYDKGVKIGQPEQWL